jgi:hypothetical protein
MKRKPFNLGLLLTSLIGYLDWGGNNSTFLFQAEADVLSKLFTEPGSVIAVKGEELLGLSIKKKVFIQAKFYLRLNFKAQT